MSNRKRIWIRIFMALLCLGLLGGITILGINGYVKKSTSDQILSPAAAAELTDADCILVLGCYVHDSGRPSDMLADRLRRGIELYRSGAAPKLLMSGDHGRKDYNEVRAMKLAAMEEGIPSEDIFMDHAGFSTYESIFRARDVFAADKIILVTQKYHLYRAGIGHGKNYRWPSPVCFDAMTRLFPCRNPLSILKLFLMKANYGTLAAIWKVDPSGYVYDARTGERLEGFKTTAYYRVCGR